jgi:hypothetical protein
LPCRFQAGPDSPVYCPATCSKKAGKNLAYPADLAATAGSEPAIFRL